jgi:hypothetical protein
VKVASTVSDGRGEIAISLLDPTKLRLLRSKPEQFTITMRLIISNELLQTIQTSKGGLLTDVEKH